MGIYIASKCKHGPRWRDLRAGGHPIISTWIDEAGKGETKSWPDLWLRCINEASKCSALIVYREPDEVLKGAWVEVGVALSHGHPVIGVGCEDFTVSHYPDFHCVSSIESALEWAIDVIGPDWYWR